jgi:hypothetical protein
MESGKPPSTVAAVLANDIYCSAFHQYVKDRPENVHLQAWLEVEEIKHNLVPSSEFLRIYLKSHFAEMGIPSTQLRKRDIEVVQSICILQLSCAFVEFLTSNDYKSIADTG